MHAILQVRARSKRLPGKALMEVLGRPILSYNLERIRRAKWIDQLIVATSDAPDDDAIERVCQDHSVPVFRGSEDDVLDRIYRCARQHRLETFARLTADNPLIDPAVIDGVVSFFLAGESQYDYVSNNHPPTWQDGQELEIIRTNALEEAWREADRSYEREHVTPFIWDRPERFRLGNVARFDDAWYRTYRWTLDYIEDFEFIRRVYEALYPTNPNFTTEQLMQLLRDNPDIQRLNSNHAGNVWYRQHAGQLRTVSI